MCEPQVSKKSEHEQGDVERVLDVWQSGFWCDMQDNEKSHETLGGLILADCVGRDIWTRPQMTEESILQFEGE